METGASGDTIRNLPIYDIRQSQSIFTGYEYNFQFQPAPLIVFTASGDFVKTKNEDNGFAIPFTPPMKNIIELKVQKNNFKFLYNLYFRFAAKFVSEQNDVDPLETGTPSYKLFNAGIGFDFSLGGSIASFDISIENLLDTKYTDHLSRYKYYAMNPGRNINAALTVPFKL
jgi:iron complex outermembrane receptor protein